MVTELRSSLAAVARSLDESVRAGRAAGTPIHEITCPAVENPWQQISFELDSAVARRLRMALRQRVVGPDGQARVVNKFNNANLVFHALSLCTTVDHLVNSRGSHLYSAAAGIHFRSVADDNRTPASAVTFVSTEPLLAQRVDAERARAALAELRHKFNSDPDTGLGTRATLHERTAQALADTRADSSPLSILLFSVTETDAEAAAGGPSAMTQPTAAALTQIAQGLGEQIEEAETELFRDGPDSFSLLARGQDYLGMVKLARLILAQVYLALPDVSLTVGVAQYAGRGTEGDLLAQAAAARRLASNEQVSVALADPCSGELRLSPHEDAG